MAGRGGLAQRRAAAHATAGAGCPGILAGRVDALHQALQDAVCVGILVLCGRNGRMNEGTHGRATKRVKKRTDGWMDEQLYN